MAEKQPEDCQDFENEFVSKAEGVFLWAELSLKMICDCLDWNQNLKTLRKKLNVLPKELNEFFRHILDAIPEDERTESHCTLAYAAKATEIESFPGGLPDYFSHQTDLGPVNILFEPSSILQFGFLGQYLEKNRDSTSLAGNGIHDIDEFLKQAIIEVQRRCNGLVELRKRPPYIGSLDPTIILQVKFTHRSIVEFLGPALEQSNRLGEFDALEAIIHTYVAATESFSRFWHLLYPTWSEFNDPGFFDFSIPFHRLVFFIINQHVASRDKYTQQLEALDNGLSVLKASKSISNVVMLPGSIVPYFHNHTGVCYPLPRMLSIGAVAALVGFPEYLDRIFKRAPQIVTGLEGEVALLGSTVSLLLNLGNSSPSQSNRLNGSRMLCFEKLLIMGNTPNDTFGILQGNSMTPWVIHLRELLTRQIGSSNALDEKGRLFYWRMLELFYP